MGQTYAPCFAGSSERETAGAATGPPNLTKSEDPARAAGLRYLSGFNLNFCAQPAQQKKYDFPAR